jgi:hypothetical protein
MRTALPPIKFAAIRVHLETSAWQAASSGKRDHQSHSHRPFGWREIGNSCDVKYNVRSVASDNTCKHSLHATAMLLHRPRHSACLVFPVVDTQLSILYIYGLKARTRNTGFNLRGYITLLSWRIYFILTFCHSSKLWRYSLGCSLCWI